MEPYPTMDDYRTGKAAPDSMSSDVDEEWDGESPLPDHQDIRPYHDPENTILLPLPFPLPDHQGIQPHKFHVGDYVSTWDARYARMRYMRVVAVRYINPGQYLYTMAVFVGDNVPLEVVELDYTASLEKDYNWAQHVPESMLAKS